MKLNVKASDFNWREMMEMLSTLTEAEVKFLLDSEVADGKRWSVIQRLHGRYTILRASRERDELYEEVIN